MGMNLIAEDPGTNIIVPENSWVTIEINDEVIFHEKVNPMAIENTILFGDVQIGDPWSGKGSPWAGAGVYMGTKKSVDDVKKKLELQ